MVLQAGTPLVRFISGFLRIMFYLLLVSMVGSTLFHLVSPLIMRSGHSLNFDVPVSLGEGSILPVQRLEVAEGILFEDAAIVDGRGKLRVKSRDPWLALISGVATIFIGFGFLYCQWLLIQILDTVKIGNPFTMDNIRRLRRIGSLLIVGGAVVPFPGYLASSLVLARVQFANSELSAPLAVYGNLILCGVLILVLAEVFRHGVDLEEDKSMTV